MEREEEETRVATPLQKWPQCDYERQLRSFLDACMYIELLSLPLVVIWPPHFATCLHFGRPRFIQSDVHQMFSLKPDIALMPFSDTWARWGQLVLTKIVSKYRRQSQLYHAAVFVEDRQRSQDARERVSGRTWSDLDLTSEPRGVVLARDHSCTSL